jgi:catechol 2,3-dioxygenase-like lactoylglutathione lyase family enzyme
MIRFKRLDHVQICIPRGRENEARHFYSNIIGLMEIPKPEALVPNGGLWYQIADIELHIGMENETNKSKRHPAFEVSDLEEARTHLLRHGVLLREDTPIHGRKRLSFFDPFNNRIELLEKISS